MEATDKLLSFGYSVTLEDGKLRYAYQGNGIPPQDEIISLLEVLKNHKAQVLDYLQLLQTPQARLKKPILIQSGYLGESLYLVANEDQDREIERGGGVCYLPEEIRSLLAISRQMDEQSLRDYLNRIHAVKKAFQGATIQWNMVKELRTQKEAKEQESFNFAERPKVPLDG